MFYSNLWYPPSKEAKCYKGLREWNLGGLRPFFHFIWYSCNEYKIILAYMGGERKVGVGS